MDNDQEKVPFKCQNPKCRTVFRKPLSWFKDTHHVHCFKCGQEFTVEAEKMPELKARLEEISKS